MLSIGNVRQRPGCLASARGRQVHASPCAWSPSVIVNDLDVIGVPVFPSKTNAPLIVDADAVLAGAIARQLLRSIPGESMQVVQGCRGIQDQELPQRRL